MPEQPETLVRPAPRTEPDWPALRSQFPIFAHARYFAACSQGPLCTRVEAALARFVDSWRAFGNPWESDWMPAVSHTADAFARLVGAPSGSVGVTASVSAALGSVLSALNFSERPKVIASALDFPTLPDILLAYQERGTIELELLPARGGAVPLDLYAQAIDARTALVCLSSASYASGALFPVQAVIELARARGALSLVDAYQSIGALALDVARLQPDFLLTGTLKYLLGTSGAALIYVAPGLAERLQPRDIGWMALANPFGTSFDHLEYAAGAARFQGGTFAISACYAAGAALDLLLELGSGVIEARVLGLVQRFVRGLLDLGIQPAGPVEAGLGPMVAVPVSGDAYAWQERLRHEEAIISSARGNALRFAFHFYNDDADVDAALEVIRRHRRSLAA